MRLGILLIMLLISGCMATTTNSYYVQTVESWRWGHGNKLLDYWGRPNKLARLPNGDFLYIYEKETYQRYPVSASMNIPTYTNGADGHATLIPAANPYPLPTNFLLRCVTSFEIDPHDIIVAVHARGNNCTANRGFVVSKSNPDPAHPPRQKIRVRDEDDD